VGKNNSMATNREQIVENSVANGELLRQLMPLLASNADQVPNLNQIMLAVLNTAATLF
jgi:hypothetical protein